MDQRQFTTTSLPSINTMLNGIPIQSSDYSNHNHGSYMSSLSIDNTSRTNNRSRLPAGHRRHASEHISSSSSRSMLFNGNDISPSLLPPPIPTRSFGTISSSSATGSSGDPSISFRCSPSSPLPSCNVYHDDNNNFRVQQREKDTTLLRPHLPPPLQLMQPKFRSSVVSTPGATAYLPLDMQALSISSCNANSSVSSSVSPLRRRTHSRSLSDFSYSSCCSTVDNNHRWEHELQQQPTTASIVKTTKIYQRHSNNVNNILKSTIPFNNNIEHHHYHRQQQQQQQQQQQKQNDPYVNNKTFHQQHFQNSANLRNFSNQSNNDAVIMSPNTTSTSETSITSTLNSGSRYTCPYCRKGFSRPSSLRTHIYSHTGEKPFICTVDGCHRRFSVHSNLRRHLRIHRTSRSSGSVPTFSVGSGFCISS